MSRYCVYLVECADKTFYTGWTNNIEKRIQEHNQGQGGFDCPANPHKGDE